MKYTNLHISLVLLVILALVGLAIAGCAPSKPAAPATPAAPSTPSAPVPPAAPPAPSTPPAVQPAKPPASGALPAVNYFAIAPSKVIPPGAIIVLVWSVTGADSVSIDNGVGQVEAQGRYSLWPEASTTFTLTATSPAGSVTLQTAVEVSDPAAVSSYRAGYTVPHVGQAVLVGKPFTLKMDAQPSKGYKWYVDYYDKSILTLVSSEYVAFRLFTRGSDGQQQFTFQPLNTRDTTILISNVNEQKPTESDSIIYDIHIKVY